MESSNEEQIKAMLEVFDFTKDETLTVEKIVKACFLNPDRKKFPTHKGIGLHSAQSAQAILSRYIPCRQEFDSENIKLYSGAKLYPSTNKEEFFERLRNSKWCGPFGINISEFKIVSGTDSGTGVGIEFSTTERNYEMTTLHYVDHEKNTGRSGDVDVGKSYCFVVPPEPGRDH